MAASKVMVKLGEETPRYFVPMVELAYTVDLKSTSERIEGSNPSWDTPIRLTNMLKIGSYIKVLGSVYKIVGFELQKNKSTNKWYSFILLEKGGKLFEYSEDVLVMMLNQGAAFESHL